MTPVTLLSEARADISRAARFYEDQAEGLGMEFAAEVEDGFERRARNPEIGAPLRRGARKLIVRRFPYVVIYRAEPDQVLILAIGHQRRHPEFWLDRA